MYATIIGNHKDSTMANLAGIAEIAIDDIKDADFDFLLPYKDLNI